MTRRTKQYFLICFLCFMLSLVIGLVVKFSFHGYRDFQSMETKENLSKYQLQIMETNNESVFLKTKNLKKIKKQSDEFLRVKVLKERKLYRDVTRTKVKIEKVYKSFDHRKEKETIFGRIDLSCIFCFTSTKRRFGSMDQCGDGKKIIPGL